MTDGYVLREDAGSIDVTPGALAQIVQQAAESVEGARVRRPRRGLDVHVDDGHVRVELELAARYGIVLPDLARDGLDPVPGRSDEVGVAARTDRRPLRLARAPPEADVRRDALDAPRRAGARARAPAGLGRTSHGFRPGFLEGLAAGLGLVTG